MSKLQEIYNDGFKNLGSKIIKNSLKAYAWFGFGMYAVVLYAFVFRVSTGYAF